MLASSPSGPSYVGDWQPYPGSRTGGRSQQGLPRGAGEVGKGLEEVGAEQGGIWE